MSDNYLFSLALDHKCQHDVSMMSAFIDLSTFLHSRNTVSVFGLLSKCASCIRHSILYLQATNILFCAYFLRHHAVTMDHLNFKLYTNKYKSGIGTHFYDSTHLLSSILQEEAHQYVTLKEFFENGYILVAVIFIANILQYFSFQQNLYLSNVIGVHIRTSLQVSHHSIFLFNCF